jgi:hypothetical protein
LDLGAVGKGCPDILVGTRKGSMLQELKDGSLPPSARKLTPDEVAFHASWKGPIAVVCSLEESIEALQKNGLMPPSRDNSP